MLRRSLIGKALIGGGTLAVLAALVFGKDVLSYAKTAYSATRDAVKREVPIEFQIQRARTAVEQLGPAIQNTLKVIAEQQVDIEHINQEIARRSEEIQKQREQMVTLKRDLESGKSAFRYASHTYSADDVRRDLRVRFERFKAAEAYLTRDQRIVASREQALYAHEKQLDQLLSQKKDLEAAVEQLDARLQTIRAEQAVSAPEIDESALSNVKRLIAEVNKQLDVQEKLLDAQGKFVGLIPVETKSTVELGNVVAEIDEYLGKTSTEKPASPAKAAPSVVKTESTGK